MDKYGYLKHIDKFECQKCGNCCRNPGYVYIGLDESETISKHLNLDHKFFLDHYCDLIMKPRLTLKTNEDDSCIFLKDNQCMIQEVKPKQCKEFPFAWRTKDSLDYCEGLKKLQKQYEV